MVLRLMILAALGSGATGSAATGSAAISSRPIGPITLQPYPVGQVLIEIESSSNPEQPGLSSSILSKLCAYEPNLHFFATIICRHYLQLGIGDKGGAEAIIHAANDCYRRPSNLFLR